MVFKVCSPDERISSILLKKPVIRRNIDISLLLNIHAELKLAYEDFGDNSVLLNITPSFFEYASYVFEKEDNDFVLCRLHIGDVVSINIEDEHEFAIIRAIFCHQKSNLQFAFVIVDWFEELNRTKLGCPMYRLQTINTTNRRRVFSINLVNTTNTMHFVHSCKDEECIGADHDSRNDLYVRNLYFFKTV
jgi:hypothetical protein